MSARPKRPSAKALTTSCAKWNKATGIGASVRYWPGFREGPGKTGKIFSEAFVLEGHTAGVYIEGAGFHSLTHVEAASS